MYVLIIDACAHKLDRFRIEVIDCNIACAVKANFLFISQRSRFFLYLSNIKTCRKLKLFVSAGMSLSNHKIIN